MRSLYPIQALFSKNSSSVKYETLILDFDGTLADTKASILQSMRYVAKQLGLSYNEHAVVECIGLPLRATFEQAFEINDTLILEAISIYRNYYNAIVSDTISLFPEVKETLQDFHSNGINLTVASSKGKIALINILKNQRIYNLFSFVGGEEDVRQKKPNPEMVQLIMQKFDHHPNQCLVVGDTGYDIVMGQNAGVPTCGVTYGNNTRNQLEEYHPTYLIDNFNTLKEVIHQ